MDKNETQEMISALADGQLRGDALDRMIRTVATDAQARNTWHTYHLIGDVLRTGDLRTGTPPAAFLAGFQVRLEREQADAAEVAAAVSAAPVNLPVASTRKFDSVRKPANDGSFRWKLVAGFASLAAVAAVGWSAVGGIGRSDQPQLATVAPGAPGRPAVMIRDPGLDEMLAAHRQLGGASALQTPAGFLRNATFEASAR